MRIHTYNFQSEKSLSSKFELLLTGLNLLRNSHSHYVYILNFYIEELQEESIFFFCFFKENKGTEVDVEDYIYAYLNSYSLLH